MDALSLLRMLGALGLVLGLMAGALWLVRRFTPRMLPGPGGGGRRLELIERTAIDPRRSAVLIRRDGREHLLLVGPEGTTVVESAIVRDALDEEAARARMGKAEAERAAAEAAVRQTRAQVAAARVRVLRALAKVMPALRQQTSRFAGRLRGYLLPSETFAAVLTSAVEVTRTAGENVPPAPATDGSGTRARSRRQGRRKQHRRAKTSVLDPIKSAASNPP